MTQQPQITEFAAPALPLGRIKLTNRFIETRAAAQPGKRDDYHDSLVPGLALRVTDRGHKSFVLHARFPDRPVVFTRRSLGTHPGLSLDEARQRARQWQSLIGRGDRPRLDIARQKLAAARQADAKFEAVAEAFIEEKLSKERKGAEVARDIRRDELAQLREQMSEVKEQLKQANIQGRQ